MRTSIGIAAVFVSTLLVLSLFFPGLMPTLSLPVLTEAPVQAATPAEAVESAFQSQTQQQTQTQTQAQSAHEQGMYCESKY